MVVLGENEGKFELIDRLRIELVEEPWAKQPYHAAETLKPEIARALVERGIKSANSAAAKELKILVQREVDRKNVVTACAVLSSSAMPEWTVDEILSVHFRMHKAEGVLFREAILKAAKLCKLRAIEILEKSLMSEAPSRLGLSEKSLTTTIANLGKVCGPPWARDQKDAAVAAMIALSESRISRLSESK